MVLMSRLGELVFLVGVENLWKVELATDVQWTFKPECGDGLDVLSS